MYNQTCDRCGYTARAASPARFCPRCGAAAMPTVETDLGEPVLPGGGTLRSVGLGYGLWALCIVGVAGIHRFYAGKYITGVLWVVTWGLFGLGSLIDLLLIPGMIERANHRLAAARL